MPQPTAQYLDPLLVSQLKTLELRARLIVEGYITGLHKSPYHGFSVEFAEHRQYNPGESLRNVDWKVFGKTERLYSKRYEEETNLRCPIVVDVSDSMRYPLKGTPGAKRLISKLEYGITTAAALGTLMLKQRDAVGLTLFDEEVKTYLPPKATSTWLSLILKNLSDELAQEEVFTHRTATSQVLHQLAQKLGRRAFVVLITDLLGTGIDLSELYPALKHLRHAQHEVLIIQLLDRATEERFELPNHPVMLQDLETGELLKVQPERIRERYVQLMQRYQHELRLKCREFDIELLEVDIRTPYDQVLTHYLRRRRLATG